MIFVWIIACLLSLAQEPDPTVVDPTLLVTGPKEGNITLDISRGTRIELFPRAKSMEIEFVLYGNSKPLLAQLDAQRPQFLTDAFAGSSGNNAWFITLYVTRADVVAEWRLENDNNLIITLKKGTPKVVPQRGLYSFEELLNDPPQRRPERPPRVLIHPLTGDAQTILLPAGDYPISSHHWKPLLGNLDRGRDLTISKRPNIYDIDNYRYVLATTRSKETKAVALYQMGRTYETLGLYREAGHYYQEVVNQEAPYPANKLHMAQARVALAIEDWASAKTHCINAYETGAGELATLECFALISRGTGAPSPSDIGRTLASKTQKPMAHLLASELMMMDHRYVEALELLRPIPAQLRGHHARIANAHLGDALFYTGDYEGAREAWRNVGPLDEIGQIVQQRQRVVRLLQAPPQEWPNFIPEFHIESRDYSKRAAEINYILAQLAKVLNEPGMAVEHLHNLLDRHHKLAYRTDVVSQLEYICSLRLGQLHEAEQWVEEAVFYEACWRPELNRVLYNTNMMQDVVEAYIELGMWQEAYELQLDINAIHTRDNEDNLEGLAQLANVLSRIGKPVEALETIEYGRARPESTPFRTRFDYLEGRIRYQLGALPEAKSAFTRAAASDEVKEEATLWLQFTNAENGDCETALPALKSFHEVPTLPDGIELTREEILLAYNRCLLNTGDYKTVVQVAKEIALLTDEPMYKDEAGYQSSYASYKEASAADLPESVESDPFWDQMIQLKKETQAIEDRARGRKAQP